MPHLYGAVLSDRDISAVLEQGGIGITPRNDANLGPASYDLTLSHEFAYFTATAGAVIVGEPLPPEAMKITPADTLRLAPGAFVLASTVETIALNEHWAAKVEGRSSLGRLGLLVHATAGFIDPGFQGQVTLELINAGPLHLVVLPGIRIAQICFYPLSSPARRAYGHATLGSHYQGQVGPTPARFDAQEEADA